MTTTSPSEPTGHQSSAHCGAWFSLCCWLLSPQVDVKNCWVFQTALFAREALLTIHADVSYTQTAKAHTLFPKKGDLSPFLQPRTKLQSVHLHKTDRLSWLMELCLGSFPLLQYCCSLYPLLYYCFLQKSQLWQSYFPLA